MITATGPAAPALKAASLEPLGTCVIGCRFQRSRPVLWAITSCCPRTKPTSGVPFGATAIMPSGTRATSSAEALPAAASATAAITRNHLIPRDYLHARVESSRSIGLTGKVAGNVTDQTTRISRAGSLFERRSEMELCARIDEARKRWDVLKHPFYERWERGELSREELAFNAGEYRHAVVAVAHAAAAAGDGEHAREEAEHVALWEEFAAAVDAPLDREPTPETSDCAAAWSPAERFRALAVLYAVESAQPAISRTKLAGLVEHYGFDAADPAAEYFRLHAERDIEHARAAREALAAAPPAQAEELAAGAQRALQANWRLLDGGQPAAQAARLLGGGRLRRGQGGEP